MPKVDVIVIGASAGGVEAVSKLIGALPKDLDAAVFVALHFPENATSLLPRILNRSRTLIAKHPEDMEPIEKAHVYVAPPGFHMLVKPGTVRLVKGPKENGSRPAIDPLFRTAASVYGKRVAAVILSGMLDDGVLGAVAVKAEGGLVFVQDPEEALFSDMPRRAILGSRVDKVADIESLALELISLAGTHTDEDLRLLGGKDEPLDITELDGADLSATLGDRPSSFTCPECNGTLFETKQAGVMHLRCRVGHSYTFDALENAQEINLEAALWEALRAMEENLALLTTMKGRAEQNHRTFGIKFYADKVQAARQRVALLRSVLNQAISRISGEVEEEGGVH